MIAVPELVWPGKCDHQVDPDPAILSNTSHIGDPGSANLVVVGDAIDALPALATDPRYLGRVRLLYADPPYNTGQKFAHYNDRMERSEWLTMMQGLMLAAKPLLAPDASVWVHLDDAEVHRMRCVMDEVFGADRFVTQIVWQKRMTRENRAAFSDNHDHILVYAMRPAVEWKNRRNLLPRTEAGTNPDRDPRGPWTSIPFVAQGFRSNQMYEIMSPSGVVLTPPQGCCWRRTRERFDELLADDMIHWTKGGAGRPRLKQFDSEAPGLVPHTVWLASEVGTNDEAKREAQNLFGKDSTFDTPKPERLLQRIIEIGTDPGELVLDPFAGSGTTAAVAHKLGRAWVTIEKEPASVDRFVGPRLASVVAATEPGGISNQVRRVSCENLPDGVNTDDAQKFVTALNKFATTTKVELDAAKLLRDSLNTDDIGPLDDDETATLRRLLGKLIRSGHTVVDVAPAAVTALRRQARTREVTEVRWAGGGGFSVASTMDLDDVATA